MLLTGFWSASSVGPADRKTPDRVSLGFTVRDSKSSMFGALLTALLIILVAAAISQHSVLREIAIGFKSDNPSWTLHRLAQQSTLQEYHVSGLLPNLNNFARAVLASPFAARLAGTLTEVLNVRFWRV